MTPLGEKLIELMRSSCGKNEAEDYFFAPDIPRDWLDNVLQKNHWPVDEEVFCMRLRGKPLFGLPKDATLYTESGIYFSKVDAFFSVDRDFMISAKRYVSFADLYNAYQERHQEKKARLFDGPEILLGVDSKKTRESKYQLSGSFWGTFFEFYAKYMGGGNPDEMQPAKPVVDGIKVCEYCGKKFDASQDTCPGCGAPA